MRHSGDSQKRDTSCVSSNNDQGHRVEGRLLSASTDCEYIQHGTTCQVMSKLWHTEYIVNS